MAYITKAVIRNVCVVLILFESVITIDAVKPLHGHRNPIHYESAPPGTIKNINTPPHESSVHQIAKSPTPWILPHLIPAIQEFKRNVFANLMSSPHIQKIWGLQLSSATTRHSFFNVLNKFLYELGHPAPAALANIVSKSVSLFDPLNMTIFFETDAISLAEFLLSRNIETGHGTAKLYVDLVSRALEKVDLNDVESVIQATLQGYADFIESFGFKLIEVVDELFELYASEIIVLHDRSLGLRKVLY